MDLVRDGDADEGRGDDIVEYVVATGDDASLEVEYLFKLGEELAV